MLNAQIVSLSIELFLIRHVPRAVCSEESYVSGDSILMKLIELKIESSGKSTFFVGC